ncbi:MULTISPECIES: hypothetical protein [unclassified Ensifer]|uniref:hypothetical protein n=1 Tax=unclassified Ensifer TaxID=2633371 RepID=UPI001146179C|nr:MULTISPECIES: hypothetical protein [unclassified Ensifer]
MTFRKLNEQSRHLLQSVVSGQSVGSVSVGNTDGSTAKKRNDISGEEEGYNMVLACLDSFEIERIRLQETISRITIKR